MKRLIAFLRERGSDRGAAAVEFAMVFPAFLMIMLGIYQFGLMQHTRTSIRYALETASRQLMIDPNTSQSALQAAVNAELAKTNSISSVTIQLVKSTGTAVPTATVSATHTQTIGVPGLAVFRIPQNVSITTAIRSI